MLTWDAEGCWRWFQDADDLPWTAWDAICPRSDAPDARDAQDGRVGAHASGCTGGALGAIHFFADVYAKSCHG